MIDCFLQIDGIKGESQDDKHKDWIGILSYNHSVSQNIGGAAGDAGGRTAGRCDHHDFQITKTIDRATPNLNRACSEGRHIKKVTLALHTAAKDKQKIMEYIMTDVLITDVSVGTVEDKSTYPIEHVSMNYGEIEWIYTATDHKDGKKKEDVKTKWSTIHNK